MLEGDVSDVLLRDGGSLRLRPPTVADADAVGEFLERMSDRSRYLRYHGAVRVTDALVRGELDPDWHRHGALIAERADPGGGRVVALASYLSDGDGGQAEVAFAVADELQGRGIGTRMLEVLADHARRAGIDVFRAEVLAEDRPMLDVFAHAGFELSETNSGGEVSVRLSIARTEGAAAARDRRDHRSAVSSLRPLLEPRSIVVVGASQHPEHVGGAVVRNLCRAGFQGALYAVTRAGHDLADIPTHRTVAGIGHPVDLAVVCVNADRVQATVEDALAAGVRAVCVISAGFAETGERGRARQERLLETVRAHGARLLGPNCLGVAVPRLGLDATFGSRSFPPGDIGLISQSGAVGLAMIAAAAQLGLGFSGFVSVGNKADVSTNDLLEYWDDDPHTRAIAIYLESVGNADHFARIGSRVARHRPIVVLAGGASAQGARAARSHTAAIAPSSAGIASLLEQAGAIHTRSFADLAATLAVLDQPHPVAGRGVAVVTNAGGLGILCADACAEAGLELPEFSAETAGALGQVAPAASGANPVDLLGTATAADVMAATAAVAADPAVAAVLVCCAPAAFAAEPEVLAGLEGLGAERRMAKPVVVITSTLDAAGGGGGGGIVRLPYAEQAATAIAHAAWRSAWLAEIDQPPPEPPAANPAAVRAVVRAELGEAEEAWLGPVACGSALAAYGIELIAQRVVATAAEGRRAAAQLGYPVAVKSARPGLHKSRLGLVELGVSGADRLVAALERVGYPALVQPMAEQGAELLIGGLRDPAVGPLVVFAAGGTAVELIGDAATARAPLSARDLARLLHSGSGARVLRAAGLGDEAVEPLAGILTGLAALLADCPWIVEVDLNPVLVRSGQCTPVDCRMRAVAEPPAGPRKTW